MAGDQQRREHQEPGLPSVELVGDGMTSFLQSAKIPATTIIAMGFESVGTNVIIGEFIS
jgi:hypothetical protein